MMVDERLAALLDVTDEKLAEARDRIRQLEDQLDGSQHGWSMPHNIDDDASLPVPRLEISYAKGRYEHELVAEYRLVYRHLLGELIAVPFGSTRIRGRASIEAELRGHDDRPHLPFRDGAHACHDAGHFGMPLYVVAPGMDPVLYPVGTYGDTYANGAAHRRSIEK